MPKMLNLPFIRPVPLPFIAVTPVPKEGDPTPRRRKTGICPNLVCHNIDPALVATLKNIVALRKGTYRCGLRNAEKTAEFVGDVCGTSWSKSCRAEMQRGAA